MKTSTIIQFYPPCGHQIYPCISPLWIYPNHQIHLVHHREGVPRIATKVAHHNMENSNENGVITLHLAALEMSEAFSATHRQAQQAVMLGQHFQKQ